jgi:hypothetical protein
VSTFSTPVTGYYGREVIYTETLGSFAGGAVTTYTINDLNGRGSSTVISSGFMLMGLMRAYWQDSDLPKFDRDYASSLAEVLLPSNTFTPTATATATDITSETASPPDCSQLTSATSAAEPESTREQSAGSSNSGLSIGVKAGISVGAGIGAILLFLAGFILYKRRLQKKANLDQEAAKQNDQPEFVPVKEKEKETYTLPSSSARWSDILVNQ